MTRKILPFLLSTCALTSFASSGAVGQDEDNSDIETIFVTSVSRSETPINKVTRAVSIITAEDLEIQSLLGDRTGANVLSRTVPGFSPSTEAMTNFGQQLRGRNFQTLIDGVPQDTSLRNGQRSLQSIDIDAIERIEVIRGGTAVYGFGADGGLINFITKRPEDGETRTIFRTGIGFSTNHFDDSIHWNTHLQTSGRQDKVDYLVSGTYMSRNNTFDADGNRRLVDPVGAQGGLDESEEVNLLGKLGFQIDENQRVEASVNYFNMKQDPDFGRRLSTDTGNLYAPPFTPEIALPGNDQDANPGNETATASLNYRNDDILGSSLHIQGFYQDIQTIFTLFPGFAQTLIESEKFGLRTTFDTPVRSDSLEFDVVWGVDYLKDDTRQRAIDGSESARGDQNAIAAFAQVEIPFGERATLTGGIRHEDVSIDVTEIAPTGELNGSETLFNVSASYLLSDTLTLFGGFSQAFSPGDILRVLTDGTFADINDVELEFIRSNNYELGLRGQLDRWDFSLVGFFSDSNNGTSFDADLNILTQPEEIGGVEATLAVRPTSNLEIGGTFAWVDGQVDLDGDDNFDEDLPTTRISPIKITAYSDVTVTDDLSLRLQAFYSGTQNNNSTAFGGGSEIDDYLIFDLLASSKLGSGEVSLGITNLFDKAYLPVINQAYNFQFSNVQGPGRRVNLNYRIAF